MQSFQKQNVTKSHKPESSRPKTLQPPKEDRFQSPSSPNEERLFSSAGQTGRTLHFTDNLLHENMFLGESSFDSPSRGPVHIGRSTMFAEADSFMEEPTVTQFLPPSLEGHEQVIVIPQKEEEQTTRLSSHDELNTSSQLPAPLAAPSNAAEIVSSSNIDDRGAPETPSSRHRRIKVNREVEKIVVNEQSRNIYSVLLNSSQAKIWSTMSDTLPHPRGLSSPSVSESM
jgi:hypothetical protein